MRPLLVSVVAATMICSVAFATPLPVPSDGSDGVLNTTGLGNITIDLSEALTGPWDTPIPVESKGKGIYDPDVWAVVYKYDSVLVTSSVVRFLPHPSGAPVVWLVSGDASIATGSFVIVSATTIGPGPGGFPGGLGSFLPLAGAGGRGPGGGSVLLGQAASGGSYGTVGGGTRAGSIYGNTKVFPLIGGSGGSGSGTSNGTGGAGGGALMIAASGALNIGGTIQSYGEVGNSGSGGGSGGGVRLIADRIVGSGLIQVPGGAAGGLNGGDGRVRLEANSCNLPGIAYYPVDDPLMLFPDSTVPQVRAITLAGKAIPSDPKLYSPAVQINDPGDYELEIEAGQVPSDATMKVRVVPTHGPASVVDATFDSGNLGSSIWKATVTVTDGLSDIQVRAILP